MNDIITFVGNNIGRYGVKIRNHSPEILVGVGIIGGVASAILACKSTTKLEKVLKEHESTTDKIHEVSENEEFEESVYSKKDAQKDIIIAYRNTAVKFVKLYGPSVVLGAASIACILGSHNILKTRNVALAAAYTAVDKGYKEYRNRVVERFGEAVDRELKYDIKAEKISDTVTDEKTGKSKKVKKTVETIGDYKTTNPYARLFDETCPAFQNDPDYNQTFLRAQQRYANDLLRAKGYLFLNEVLDMCSIPIDDVKLGQQVGWVYDEENQIGDNYVDFGIYDIHRESARNFVSGYEAAVMLDFNVDGYILDRV